MKKQSTNKKNGLPKPHPSFPLSHLHKQVNGFHQHQLIVRRVRAQREVEPRVAAKDEFGSLVVSNGSKPRVPPRGRAVHVILQGALVGVVQRDVVLGEAGL